MRAMTVIVDWISSKFKEINTVHIIDKTIELSNRCASRRARENLCGQSRTNPVLLASLRIVPALLGRDGQPFLFLRILIFRLLLRRLFLY